MDPDKHPSDQEVDQEVEQVATKQDTESKPGKEKVSYHRKIILYYKSF